MTEPIISDISAYLDFPFVKLTGKALSAIDSATRGAEPWVARQMSKITRCLECFLQISDGPTLSASESWVANSSTLGAFIGALNSPSFLKADSSSARCAYIRAGVYLITALGVREYLLTATRSERKHLLINLTARFLNTPLLEEAVTLWRAWPVKSLKGPRSWLPLYCVYHAHGLEVANILHRACEDYVAVRRLQKIPGLKELARFIAQLPSFRFEDANHPDSSYDFFYRFYRFYVEARGETCKPQTVLADWTRGFYPFAKSALIGAGLFAAPAGGMPGPLPEERPARATNKSDEKLIMPLPPELGTYEALAFLREEIPQGLGVIHAWATQKSRDLYERVKARRRHARKGTARLKQQKQSRTENGRYLVSRANPAWYENACATYEQYGHIARDDYAALQVLFPQNLDDVAYELGIPTAGTLLPHATLLVHEHPQINPAFLETLELWNEHDHLTGLRRLGNVWYLFGYKWRRGSKRARQRIQLTKKSFRWIIEILRITANVRKHLRAAGDPNWRFLFLTCAKGFSTPTPVTRFSPLTSGQENVDRFASEFLAAGASTAAQAQLLASNFSLLNIRGTRGICIFVETHSEIEMAKALGHARRSKVLNHYLPASVAGFLRIRWMRAFQTRMVVHMTDGTAHQLQASGLSTQQALNKFLQNHPFPDIDRLTHAHGGPAPASPRPAQREGTFVINCGSGTLTVLTNIIRTVNEAKQPVTADAKYWASLSRHVLDYVKVHSTRQPAIATALQYAESHNRNLDLTKAVYA